MSEQDTWEACKHGHYVACIDCLREELERVNSYANSADAVADGLRLELGETQREVERLRKLILEWAKEDYVYNPSLPAFCALVDEAIRLKGGER